MKDVICLKKSDIHGRGVFTLESVKKDQLLCEFNGHKTKNPSRFDTFSSITGLWRATCMMRFLNHSETPNAYLKDKNLYALYDINEDIEITINYKNIIQTFC